jgi:hypothetical protein
MHVSVDEPEEVAQFVQELACITIPDEVAQARVEVRVYAMVLTGSFLWDEIEPVFYLLGVRTSAFDRVVALTHLPQVFAVLLVACFMVTLPHFVALVCMPHRLALPLPRLLACVAACLMALMWFYLANIAWPLDLGAVPWLYMRSGAGALGMAALYAVSLNAQQLRNLAHRLLP